LPSAHNRRGSNTQKGIYKRSARYVFVIPLFDPKRRGFELVCFDPSDFQHCAPSLPVRPLSRIRMFRHSQGDFRTDRKPCISRFHRLSVINHQHRGEGRGIGGVAVVVRKPKPPTNKANFRFVVYKIVEIACIGTRWNEKNNRRSGLRLFVCLLNPLADFAPIRGIAKYCTPPATFQEDLSPSVSGV
jgi:hypothetical protein